MKHHKECIKGINQIKFKTSIIRSNVCDHSDAYILVSETTTVRAGDNDAAKQVDERNKGVILKNCSSLTDWIRMQITLK